MEDMTVDVNRSTPDLEDALRRSAASQLNQAVRDRIRTILDELDRRISPQSMRSPNDLEDARRHVDKLVRTGAISSQSIISLLNVCERQQAEIQRLTKLVHSHLGIL